MSGAVSVPHANVAGEKVFCSVGAGRMNRPTHGSYLREAGVGGQVPATARMALASNSGILV